MVRGQKSILEQLASEAIRLGVDTIEVDYKDGYERIFAVRGEIGYELAQLRSSSPDAGDLMAELRAITKKQRRVTVGGSTYALRARVYDSFGEDAFFVQIRRV